MLIELTRIVTGEKVYVMVDKIIRFIPTDRGGSFLFLHDQQTETVTEPVEAVRNLIQFERSRS